MALTKLHREQRIRRLYVLAAFLRKLKPKVFNIGEWTNNNDSCGMVCCAGGWACRMPEFRRAGLHPDGMDDMPEYKPRGMSITLKGFYAIQEFFGLEEREVLFYFSSSGYADCKNCRPSPKRVAKELKGLAAKKLKELGVK